MHKKLQSQIPSSKLQLHSNFQRAQSTMSRVDTITSGQSLIFIVYILHPFEPFAIVLNICSPIHLYVVFNTSFLLFLSLNSPIILHSIQLLLLFHLSHPSHQSHLLQLPIYPIYPIYPTNHIYPMYLSYFSSRFSYLSLSSLFIQFCIALLLLILPYNLILFQFLDIYYFVTLIISSLIQIQQYIIRGITLFNI